MDVGTLLQLARQHARLTQAEVALAAGTSPAAVTRYERGRVSPSTDTLTRLLAACGLESRVQLVPRHTQLDAHLRAAMSLTLEQRLLQVEPQMLWVIDRLLCHKVPFVVEGATAAVLHGAPGRVVWHAIAISRELADVQEFHRATIGTGLDPVDREGLHRRRLHPVDLLLDEECPTFDVSGMLLEVRCLADPDTVDCLDVEDEAVLLRSLDALCADPFRNGVDATVVQRLRALQLQPWAGCARSADT